MVLSEEANKKIKEILIGLNGKLKGLKKERRVILSSIKSKIDAVKKKKIKERIGSV